jgi:hypothetical protein
MRDANTIVSTLDIVNVIQNFYCKQFASQHCIITKTFSSGLEERVNV